MPGEFSVTNQSLHIKAHRTDSGFTSRIRIKQRLHKICKINGINEGSYKLCMYRLVWY